MKITKKMQHQFFAQLLRELARDYFAPLLDELGETESAAKLRLVTDDMPIHEVGDALALARDLARAPARALARALAFDPDCTFDLDLDHDRERHAKCLLAAANKTGLKVPVLDNPYREVARLVEAETINFDMGVWHEEHEDCGTTCCLAGSMCVASDGGVELAEALGWPIAGGLIFAASCEAAGKTVTIPDFYRTDETDEVLQEIREAAKGGGDD